MPILHKVICGENWTGWILLYTIWWLFCETGTTKTVSYVEVFLEEKGHHFTSDNITVKISCFTGEYYFPISSAILFRCMDFTCSYNWRVTAGSKFSTVLYVIWSYHFSVVQYLYLNFMTFSLVSVSVKFFSKFIFFVRGGCGLCNFIWHVLYVHTLDLGTRYRFVFQVVYTSSQHSRI